MGTAQLAFAVVLCGGATGSHVTGSDVNHVIGNTVSHMIASDVSCTISALVVPVGWK